MMKKLTRILIAVALASGAVLTPVMGGTASADTFVMRATAGADTLVSLPQLGAAYQIVVDSAMGYVFISEDGNLLGNSADGKKGASGILVTDLAGNYVTTLDAGHDTFGLALSPNGQTLYAALINDHEIAAISVPKVTDPTPTQALYAMPSTDYPKNLAIESGKLWVSDQAGIGDFDLAAPDPAFETQANMSFTASAALASDPNDTGVLMVANRTFPGQPFSIFNVTTNPPTQINSGTPKTPAGAWCPAYRAFFNENIAVMPGGSSFMIGGCEFDANFNFQRDYAPGSLVAVAPGSGLIAISGPQWSRQEIFQPGNTAELNYIDDSPNLNQRATDCGMAFTPDGSALYVVVSNVNTHADSLLIAKDPGHTPTKLSLTAPATPVIFGANVTIAGKLSLATRTVPAGTPVTITRTEKGAAAFKAYSVTTRSGGSFTMTDPAPAKGTYTYTASYAGSATTLAATSSPVTVSVARVTPLLRLTTSAADYVSGAKVHVSVTLGPTLTDHVVSVYAQPAGLPRTLLRTAAVNSAGNLTLSYPLIRSTTFTATFAGDAHNGPVTATHTVGAWAKIMMSDSGSYGTAKLGGITYRLYHSTAKLHETVAVTPDKAGQCVKLELQELLSGGDWAPDKTLGCYTLSKTSKISAALALNGDAGGQFRLRADYVRSAKDTTNLSTSGPWFYFAVMP